MAGTTGASALLCSPYKSLLSVQALSILLAAAAILGSKIK